MDKILDFFAVIGRFVYDILAKIDVKGFTASLPIMGKGMLGIFIVTLVIIAVVIILNKTTTKE